MPFTSAAKRAEVFCAVPMIVARPLQAPDRSTNLREMGPLSAREPAKARPNPSRMDFLPSSMTSGGMFSYCVCRTKFPTYFVRPGVLGNSPCPGLFAALAESTSNEAPIMPSEVLPKSRRRIVHREVRFLRLNIINTDLGFFSFMVRDGQVVAIPFGNKNTRFCAKRARNTSEQRVMVGILLFKDFQVLIAGKVDA